MHYLPIQNSKKSSIVGPKTASTPAVGTALAIADASPTGGMLDEALVRAGGGRTALHSDLIDHVRAGEK